MTRHGASTHWSGLEELGSAWGIATLFWIYKLLGRRPFQLVLAPVILFFFVSKPTQRRASRQFLTRCYEAGGLSRPPNAWTCLRHFFSFGEAALDKFVAWNGGFDADDITYHGYDEVRAVLDSGRGALLLGSHLGNLEICRALSHLHSVRLRVLTHTRHARNFNRLLERLDDKSQMSLQQVTELGVAEAAELSAWVAGGGVVLIAADRVSVSGARTSFARFLRHVAPFPQGPFILGNLLACPVFTLFCLRRGRRFDAVFEPFAQQLDLPRKDRARAIDEYAARFAERLEQHCLTAPLQWFNFFPFWSQHELAGHARSARMDERASAS